VGTSYGISKEQIKITDIYASQQTFISRIISRFALLIEITGNYTNEHKSTNLDNLPSGKLDSEK